MYDIERLNSIINDINRFFKDLDIVALNEKNVNEPEKFHAAAMLMFGIMNRTIDLAQEILVKNDLPMPATYSGCFPNLSKAGLIDKKLTQALEKIIDERGIFAHYYYDINKKIVLRLLKEIFIVKSFIEKVKEIVRKSQKSM
jgi:uncharacterized protein YutE (UPF0331/DUF86 family)